MILATTATLSVSSLFLSLGVAVTYAIAMYAGERGTVIATRRVLWIAWFLHAVLLAWSMLGLSPVEVPHFGFAAALSVTAWLMLTVYLIESHLYPQLKAVWAFAGMAAVTVLVSLAYPGQVLHHSVTPWLPLHWALGLASYGLFAAAVVHAWLMMRAESQMRTLPSADKQVNSGLPLLTLERLTFRFVLAGFVLLTATLLAGWLFSETLYGPGKVWQWNHKTIFSVLAWLAFAVLLIGRARFGWRGRTAVRVLYSAAALLLLAYVGSRFVLEVLLGRVV